MFIVRKNLRFVETPAGEEPGSGSGGENAGFTPPASQEELNRIIADRLARERSKFADYDELKAKAQQLAGLEEAAKTAEQKQAEELEALRSRVTEFETRDQISGWKSEIVKDSHIAANLLRGSTREELEQHFQELSAAIPVPNSTPAPAQAVAGVGQSPNQGSENVSIDAQIQAAEKAGDKELTASLKAIKLGSISN